MPARSDSASPGGPHRLTPCSIRAGCLALGLPSYSEVSMAWHTPVATPLEQQSTLPPVHPQQGLLSTLAGANFICSPLTGPAYARLGLDLSGLVISSRKKVNSMLPSALSAFVALHTFLLSSSSPSPALPLLSFPFSLLLVVTALCNLASNPAGCAPSPRSHLL